MADTQRQAGVVAGAIDRETAIEELAKYLHWKMWHLEPDTDDADVPEWVNLTEGERSLYLTAVKCLLDNERLIKAAVSYR